MYRSPHDPVAPAHSLGPRGGEGGDGHNGEVRVPPQRRQVLHQHAVTPPHQGLVHHPRRGEPPPIREQGRGEGAPETVRRGLRGPRDGVRAREVGQRAHGDGDERRREHQLRQGDAADEAGFGGERVGGVGRGQEKVVHEFVPEVRDGAADDQAVEAEREDTAEAAQTRGVDNVARREVWAREESGHERDGATELSNKGSRRTDLMSASPSPPSHPTMRKYVARSGFVKPFVRRM